MYKAPIYYCSDFELISLLGGKYTKDLIPEDGDIPMHGWKVYRDKVCQGYRNSWECQKLY
jgi:hypothetical protein